MVEYQLTDALSAPQSEVEEVVLLADTSEYRQAMELAHIDYEGELPLSGMTFCKIETYPDFFMGVLCVPKLLDLLGSKYKIQFLVNKKYIVIIDDSQLSIEMVERMEEGKNKLGSTKEQFLYRFFAQLLYRDLEILGKYENHIMAMEENVSKGRTRAFQQEITPLRRELLTLRGYYEELMDVGERLEENENEFFSKKGAGNFRIISQRAQRLMTKTVHLLEYAKQLRDAYQTQADAQQSQNMQFLTVISTIFFPLTLITGWFGMNFENMPFLKDGYPFVVGLSVVILILCILFFKRKRML